jgi:GAF domain-containing protein
MPYDATGTPGRVDAERFVARASHLLLTTPSAEQALRELCELVAPEVADWCVVERVSGDRPAELLGAAHGDERALAELLEGHELRLSRLTDDDPLRRAIATRETLVSGVAGPRSTLLEPLGAGPWIVVPVLLADAVVALLMIGNAPERRMLDADDVALAEALARRAGLGLERARLFEAERAATRRTAALQRVTASLSAAATAEDVIRVAIGDGLATIGA